MTEPLSPGMVEPLGPFESAFDVQWVIIDTSRHCLPSGHGHPVVMHCDDEAEAIAGADLFNSIYAAGVASAHERAEKAEAMVAALHKELVRSHGHYYDEVDPERGARCAICNLWHTELEQDYQWKRRQKVMDDPAASAAAYTAACEQRGAVRALREIGESAELDNVLSALRQYRSFKERHEGGTDDFHAAQSAFVSLESGAMGLHNIIERMAAALSSPATTGGKEEA